MSHLSSFGSRGYSRRDFARFTAVGAIASVVPTSIAGAEVPSTSMDHGAIQGAGFYRLALGDVAVSVVSDGGMQMDTAQLFGDVPAESMQLARRETFMPDGPYPGHLNGLLVRSGSSVILVDTGYGGGGAPTTGQLMANLARAGFLPADVTHVLLTHGHPDHVGGLLDADGKLAFPNARVLMSEAEHAFWTGDAPQMPASKIPSQMVAGMAAGARRAISAAGDRLEMISPGQTIAGAITIIDAAGHTPGHIALRVDGGGDSLLYVTDAVHLRPLQFARPDFQILYDADRERAIRARRMLLDMAVTDRLRVAGAHIAFPAVGYVERKGDGYAWVPDVWRW